MTDHLCPNRDPRVRAIFYKIVNGMIRRREIKYVWYLPWGNGRPNRVLSNRNVERDKLLHEVLLTYVLLSLAYVCRRLTDVDPELLPDAEIEVPDPVTRQVVRHFIELDTGSMRGRKIDDRLALWAEESDEPVLWIAMTEERRRSLRARDRNKNSLFAVWEEVVRNPHGEIWLNVSNQLVTLQ
jgi:hypothetical protein